MDNPAIESLQSNFFKKIKQSIPPNHSLVNEISELLNISTDSAYRRIRNKTSLTMQEVSILSKHYNIVPEFESNLIENNVNFNYSSLKTPSDFNNYITRILTSMKEIEKSENGNITYAAIDIPIFHHFNYPKLAAFKIFYWMKGVMNVPSLDGVQFTPSLINNEFLDLGKEIYDVYSRIPATEVWTSETIKGHLEQIKYFWDSGIFKTKDDALEICELTREEILAIKSQADTGSKAKEKEINLDINKFNLYHSEIEIGNNCILVNKGEISETYISCHTLNYMCSTNKQYFLDTSNWMENLIRKSVLISGVSEKLRYKFFKMVMNKIDNVTKIIKEGD